MQRLNQTKDAVHADSYFFPYMTLIHEYNARGAHRLVIHDRVTKNGSTYTTDWHAYEDIIAVKDEMVPDYREKRICATTEFWAGVLPRVFKTEAAERL